MSLILLDQLSLPGDAAKPNEDAFAHLDHAALVLDGATPLGPSLLPGASDAAWIAQFGARRLAAHLKDGDVPQEALKHALADAEKSFAGLTREPIREKWQTPCASLMLAVEQGKDSQKSEIEFLWFGDCAAIVEQDAPVVRFRPTDHPPPHVERESDPHDEQHRLSLPMLLPVDSRARALRIWHPCY